MLASFVGLLPLPDVVGDGCGVETSAAIPVFQAPSASGSRLGSISLRVTGKRDGSCDEAVLGTSSGASEQFDELPTEESGYEILAAIVYQRSGNWFRIALQKGSGWIHRASAADFQEYPE